MPEVLSNKKKLKANPEKNMSFWEHLEELRWHLIRSAIAIVVITIVAFVLSDWLFDEILLAPKSPNFITAQLFCKLGNKFGFQELCINQTDLKLININLAGQLTTLIYVCLIAGLVISLPYVLWEIWRFVKPALKPNERKYSSGLIWIIFLLFIIGVLISYFLFVPLTINFLGSYKVSDVVENQITLSSYISTITSLTLATGIVFELPVVIYFLAKIGLLSPDFLKRNRRTAIVIILTIAAIITPGTDIFSQLMVSFPLFFLYQISISVAKKAYKPVE